MSWYQRRASRRIEDAHSPYSGENTVSASWSSPSWSSPARRTTDIGVIGPKRVDAISRVVQSEIGGWKDPEFSRAVGPHVASMLNRVASPAYANTIEGVLNQPKQYSAINTIPGRTFANLPDPRPRTTQAVEQALSEMAAGKPQTSATDFLNPEASDLSALKQWGYGVVNQALKNNEVYGFPGTVAGAHYMGTAVGTPIADAPFSFRFEPGYSPQKPGYVTAEEDFQLANKIAPPGNLIGAPEAAPAGYGFDASVSPFGAPPSATPQRATVDAMAGIPSHAFSNVSNAVNPMSDTFGGIPSAATAFGAPSVSSAHFADPLGAPATGSFSPGQFGPYSMETAKSLTAPAAVAGMPASINAPNVRTTRSVSMPGLSSAELGMAPTTPSERVSAAFGQMPGPSVAPNGVVSYGALSGLNAPGAAPSATLAAPSSLSPENSLSAPKLTAENTFSAPIGVPGSFAPTNISAAPAAAPSSFATVSAPATQAQVDAQTQAQAQAIGVNTPAMSAPAPISTMAPAMPSPRPVSIAPAATVAAPQTQEQQQATAPNTAMPGTMAPSIAPAIPMARPPGLMAAPAPAVTVAAPAAFAQKPQTTPEAGKTDTTNQAAPALSMTANAHSAGDFARANARQMAAMGKGPGFISGALGGLGKSLSGALGGAFGGGSRGGMGSTGGSSSGGGGSGGGGSSGGSKSGGRNAGGGMSRDSSHGSKGRSTGSRNKAR